MGRSFIPTFRYHDAPVAIEFLVEAFGFEVVMDVRDGDRVEHAELVFDDGMVMLGSVRDTEFGRHVTTVVEAGKPTSSPYLVVDDVHGHAERARAAGARIVMEPEQQDYGGANYVAADPEGNLWSFGSYDPWAPAVG